MLNESDNGPVTFVIFGASGDLTNRKLIPALFSLYCKHRLPEIFHVLGFSNLPWDDATFRQNLRGGVNEFAGHPFSEQEWADFSAKLSYMTGDFTKADDFERLKSSLEKIEQGKADRMYYLATPPQFFTDITQNLGTKGMLEQEENWRRVVIEKPFGSSLETAQSLNKALHKVLKESQIFRIDHYLGKETVQNLLIFRFANTVFEPVWNNKYIDSVQISVSEEVGVGHRGGYYDKAGVVRDMFQNHLLQLLTLVAIDPPDTLTHKDLHARKLEILKALKPITGKSILENTVRGQYSGYRQESSVAPDSQTATFAAIRAEIDNKRWQGVPFYMRSGKNLPVKCTEIIVQFKCPVYAVQPMAPGDDITPDVLAFCIQPDEGIFLRFEAKVPDTEADTRSVEMEFHYSTSFGCSSIPEAYERLILEIIQGDHTLFTQDDTTELAWEWIDPILEGWRGSDAPALEMYEPGSWGPEAAERMMKQDGRSWMVTCGQHKNDGNC